MRLGLPQKESLRVVPGMDKSGKMQYNKQDAPERVGRVRRIRCREAPLREFPGQKEMESVYD